MHYTGALQLEKKTRVYFPTRGVCFGCISGLGVFPVYFTPCIFHAVFILFFAQCVAKLP
jgi:hypothetical protein